MPQNYQLTEDQKKDFASIFILEYMINKPKAFGVMLDSQDESLEPILDALMVKDYVDIQDDKYTPTEKGREALKKFMGRYSEFLTMFDIFSAVDLGEGSFAFSEYFSFNDQSAWKAYLNQERWDDLRIAVANYKDIDPIEIVFMSFMSEGRFGRDTSGWQFSLLLGTVWDEIIEICSSALHAEHLGYSDEQGEVSGEDVLRDVITQGSAIMADLLKRESNLPSTQETNHDDGTEADRDRYVDPVDFDDIDDLNLEYDDWVNDPRYRSNRWDRRNRW